MSSSLKFSELDFEKDYDESKDSDYAPGDPVDSVYSRVDEALALLESGKRSLLLEDVSTACNDLAMSCELMAEEHGELGEKCAEAYHHYGRALLSWSRMEGEVFEHAMSGFDLGESEEPKVEVEDTDSLPLDERKEIEDGVSEALDENYDTHTNIADCHYNEASDSEESSDEDSEDTEDSETSEDESELEDIEETEIFEPTNLELSWEMLELARLGFTKTGEKEQLGEVYLDLGQVGMENQDYDLAAMDFGESLKLKKALLPTDSRSLASVFYHLGMALAYSGKMSEAEVNLNSAISTLEARSKNIAKMEVSEYVIVEKAELEACIQEIREIVVDHKDMHKQISIGTVGAKLATRIGVNSEAIMSAKQSGSATVGTA